MIATLVAEAPALTPEMLAGAAILILIVCAVYAFRPVKPRASAGLAYRPEPPRAAAPPDPAPPPDLTGAVLDYRRRRLDEMERTRVEQALDELARLANKLPGAPDPPPPPPPNP